MPAALTIGKKLGIGLTASLACLAVLSFASLRVISALGGSLDEAVNVTARKVDLVSRTRDAFQGLRSGLARDQIAYAVLQTEGRSSGARKGECSACHMPASPADSLRAIQASGDLVRQHGGALRGLLSDRAEQKALATLEEGASQWAAHSSAYLELAGAGRFSEAHSVLTDKMLPVFEQADAAAKSLTARQGEALGAAHQKAQATIRMSRWMIVVLAGLDLFVILAVLWLVFRIAATLRKVVADVGSGADQLASAAREVSSAGQTLAQGSSEQAASLEETSASSEQIKALAHSNGEKSRQAAKLASDSQRQTSAAVAALGELGQTMKKIDASTSNLAEVLRVIESIAFQTNILALNAAVEAARAGEAGQGFAVVADEVRNLAQRCAQAARDTTGLIDESVLSCSQGNEKVKQIAAIVHEVAGSSLQVMKLVEEVNQSSQQQTSGIAEVSQAMAQMSQVTQGTAASAEQNAAAGEQISALSEVLKNTVRQLSVMVHGRHAESV